MMPKDSGLTAFELMTTIAIAVVLLNGDKSISNSGLSSNRI